MAAPLIEWGSGLVLGIPEIDRQHRALTDLINRLAAAMQEGRTGAGIVRMVHEVVGYTRQHFRHEEGMMLRSGYPMHAEHHARHEALLRTVRALQAADMRAPQRRLESLQALRSWVTEHIQKSDRAFADHLRQTQQLKAEAAEG